MLPDVRKASWLRSVRSEMFIDPVSPKFPFITRSGAINISPLRDELMGFPHIGAAKPLTI
jgi:hypothetical protein